MNNNHFFKLPNTKTAVVVWERNGQRREVTIPTPAGMKQMRDHLVMHHKIGMNEVRAVKSDPHGVIADVRGLNIMGLTMAMSRV
jgi:kynureninase